MTRLVKLGGSLITDKRIPNTYRPEVMTRLAQEIARSLVVDPTPLVIGHGSGSFGHVAAHTHGTADGVSSRAGWIGFAEVAAAAGRLSALVLETLLSSQVPVVRFPPSASTIAHDAHVDRMMTVPIERALDVGLVPLVHGDVAFDAVRGGTILSTEAIFFHLAQHLPVTTIMLLGEVDGVYDASGTVIPQITPKTLAEFDQAIGGSYGTDVTGGMRSKVQEMIALVTQYPHLQIKILSGLVEGRLEAALRGDMVVGTVICAD